MGFKDDVIDFFSDLKSIINDILGVGYWLFVLIGLLDLSLLILMCVNIGNGGAISAGHVTCNVFMLIFLIALIIYCVLMCTVFKYEFDLRLFLIFALLGVIAGSLTIVSSLMYGLTFFIIYAIVVTVMNYLTGMFFCQLCNNKFSFKDLSIMAIFSMNGDNKLFLFLLTLSDGLDIVALAVLGYHIYNFGINPAYMTFFIIMVIMFVLHFGFNIFNRSVLSSALDEYWNDWPIFTALFLSLANCGLGIMNSLSTGSVLLITVMFVVTIYNLICSLVYASFSLSFYLSEESTYPSFFIIVGSLLQIVIAIFGIWFILNNPASGIIPSIMVMVIIDVVSILANLIIGTNYANFDGDDFPIPIRYIQTFLSVGLFIFFIVNAFLMGVVLFIVFAFIFLLFEAVSIYFCVDQCYFR